MFMKKLILFLLGAMFLMSCGGAGQQPTDYITMGQAWHHVAQSWGYWIPLIIVTIIGGYFMAYKPIMKYKLGDIDSGQATFLVVLFLAAFLFTLLVRPCEVAANTTVEQAARGGWIGY